MDNTTPFPILPQEPPLRFNPENGVVYVGKTRVPIDTVINAFLDGDSPETIAQSYDVLTLREVYATISFYLHTQPEVEAYLKQRREEGDKLRREIESAPGYREQREQLFARARARGLRA